jgi:hypothetical protein
MKTAGVVGLIAAVLGILVSFSAGCGQGEGPVVFTTLRSQYKTLDDDEIKSMVKNRGFFDRRWNKYHSFANDFELKTVNNQAVVIDHATGLVWHQSGSEMPVVFSEVKPWLDALNRKGYAGYSNWRLPTIEEAASLLERKQVKYRHINPLFSTQQYSIHSGDTYNAVRLWGVSFQYGGIFKVGIMEPNFVRPVTTYTGK